MGENFKKLREDMELWQSPDYQEAEREYAQMNQELMEEVTLSAPGCYRAKPYFSEPLVYQYPHFPHLYL